MSHIASVSQTSAGLRLTLQQLEQDDSLDLHDPAFVNLKRGLLLRLTMLGKDSAAETQDSDTDICGPGQSMYLGRIPIVRVDRICKCDHSMVIHIVLHVFDEDLLLFAGPPAECPPIPRAGDEIVHEQRRVRLEGIRYHYQADHLEIGLLA